MKKEKEQEKSSSPLIDKINQLQAKYQAEIQGVSEEEKKAVQASKLYSDLYSALIKFVEQSVYVSLKKIGAKPEDIDTNAVIEELCEDLFGNEKKPAAIETFQSKNGAQFTTAYYKRINTITLRTYNKEREWLLDRLCIQKEELEQIKKWSICKIKGHYSVDIEENKDKIIDRIRNNPERVFAEQQYLKKRIGLLPIYMDIVAGGPKISKRSTTKQPVYRWVGGSVGAYLSPVMDCEWQKMDMLQDSSYRTSSLITRLAVYTAKKKMEETLGVTPKEEESDFTKELLKLPVPQKMAEQMSLVLEPARKKAEAMLESRGVSKNEHRVLMQTYYKALSSVYRAKTESDAVVSPKWTWNVIHGLTAEEAAWLFEREIGACIPSVTFAWKDAFKEQLELKGKETLFKDQTEESTAQRWPQEVRDTVLEIKKARDLEYYTNILNDITNAKKEYDMLLQEKMKLLLEEISVERDLIADLRKKRKGAVGLGGL